MPGKHVFEYAIIRVVPRVEREEFLNVGVILYCRDLNFLKSRIQPDEQKLLTLFPQADVAEIKENLDAFCRIATGGKEGGNIGQLNLGERFRWLTAMRSTIVQTSRIHPGMCEDGDETLNRLMEQMVF